MAYQSGQTQNNYQGGSANPILLSPAEQSILRAKEGNTEKYWGCALLVRSRTKEGCLPPRLQP